MIFYRFSIGRRFCLTVRSSNRNWSDVLSLYHPQRIEGKLLKFFLCLISKIFPKPFFLKKIEYPASSPFSLYLIQGYIRCNPSHGERYVCLLKWDGKVCIGKLAFENSILEVKEEAKRLSCIQGSAFLPPRLITEQAQEDWYFYAMEKLDGESPRSIMDSEVINFLRKVEKKDETRKDSKLWIEALLEKTEFKGLQEDLKERLISEIPWKPAFLHGDFTAWNLIKNGNKLRAIDFEAYQPNAVAGLDLVYGIFREIQLIQRVPTHKICDEMRKKMKSPIVFDYLDSVGWGKNIEDLILFTLIWARIEHEDFQAKELVVNRKSV